MSGPAPTETSNKRTVDQAELSTDDNRPAKKQQLDEQVSAPAAELPQSSSTSAPVEVVITATQATDDLEEAMNAQPEAGPSRSTQKNGNKNQKGKAKGQGKPNKYKGTHDRGVWERRPPRELPEGEEKEARLPKKKVALLLGFSGAGYNGMQYQLTEDPTSANTIEMLVFKALGEMGAISKDNSTDPKKVDLSRAARTDAGVSAAGNVISLKMITEPPGCETQESFVTKINELLPPDIRVWGFQRATSGFNARTSCDTRVYEYLFPSYILLPPIPDSTLDKHLQEVRKTAGLEPEPVPEFWRCVQEATDALAKTAPVPASVPVTESGDEKTAGEAVPEVDPEILRRRKVTSMKRDWRCGQEELGRFREIVKEYLGTHNFHNYTLFLPHDSPTVKRYMLSIDVAEPEVYGNIEWISVKIHGQSFMLHQIRKMISMAVLATRTKTPASVVSKTFGPEGIHIPKAPALGLLLEQPRFGSYNERVESSPAEHGGITFAPFEKEMKAFKLKWIYERLRADEEKMAVYVSWANNVDHTFDHTLGWLGCTGEIPETAKKTIKVKEKISKKQAALNAKKAAEAALPEGEGGRDAFEAEVASGKKIATGVDALESEDEEVEIKGKDDER